jgi:hypothetical protein
MTPEIRAFEYSLGLFAVLIGLAVADIATSFHRLLRHRATVNWDPLALLAALYALLMAICMWFDVWGVRNFAATRHFLFYLSMIASLFVLFLIAAASLPDEAGGTRDLRQYYAENRRYFWFLVALFQLIYVAQGLYFVGGELGSLPTSVSALLLGQMIAPLALALALWATPSRLAHYVIVGLLYAVLLVHYWRMSIN